MHLSLSQVNSSDAQPTVPENHKKNTNRKKKKKIAEKHSAMQNPLREIILFNFRTREFKTESPV